MRRPEGSGGGRTGGARLLGRAVVLAVFVLAVAAGTGRAAAIPGELRASFRYADEWRGWPVAPVDRQHPIRGSFLDPRPSGYHIGVDIAVRDDRPAPDAPPGRTHRVYAVEGGTAHVPPEGARRGCVHRSVRVGHFAYFHVDPVVAEGARVGPGQHIGWTCRTLWHVHLSEWILVGGVRVWVDPLHAGGKLAPFVDTLPPRVHAVEFFTPAATAWKLERAALVAPAAGRRLGRASLRGLVDVRALVSDPQSFRGWLDDGPRHLYADHHPYRVRVTVRRGARVVLRRTVFQADRMLGEGEEAAPVPPLVWMAHHFAPGTRQNLGAKPCLDAQPADCGGRYWLRLFAGPGGARFWNTRRVADGAYVVEVEAWDRSGNRAARRVPVRVANVR